MHPNELRPLYGRRCRATVRCAPCGGYHTITGTLSPAKLKGDVVLEGHTLPVSDLMSVNAEQPVALRTSSLARGVPYLWLAWLLLVWLLLLAR